MASYTSAAGTGKINEVYLNPIGGFVQLDYGYGVNTICSINEELVRVLPESCKALYAGLLAADAQNKNVSNRYNGDFSCSSTDLGHFTSAKKEAYLISFN